MMSNVPVGATAFRPSLRYRVKSLWARIFPKPSNLEVYAREELKRAGLFDKDGSYGGMMGDAVLKMVRQFDREGHSGYSASMAISIFQKVARFNPLTPLTGADDEWNEIGNGEYQNRRCSHVFKGPGGAYDIDGRVFEDPDGSRYTNFDSRVPVVFPYTPHTEIVKRP